MFAIRSEQKQPGWRWRHGARHHGDHRSGQPRGDPVRGGRVLVPDVAADLVTRAIGAFNEALGVCHLYAEGSDDDADDDDD